MVSSQYAIIHHCVSRVATTQLNTRETNTLRGGMLAAFNCSKCYRTEVFYKKKLSVDWEKTVLKTYTQLYKLCTCFQT